MIDMFVKYKFNHGTPVITQNPYLWLPEHTAEYKPIHKHGGSQPEAKRPDAVRNKLFEGWQLNLVAHKAEAGVWHWQMQCMEMSLALMLWLSLFLHYAQRCQ